MTQPRPFDGTYLMVTFGEGTRQLTWYPNADPEVEQPKVESIRAWIAAQGFTDDVPQLQQTWLQPTLDDELGSQVMMQTNFANDWPSVYLALGFEQ